VTHPIIGRCAPMPRPTMRQLPRHWTLEETRNGTRLHWWQSGGNWVGIIVFLVAVFASLETIARLI